tara:strand:- start:76 stop:780 length:705 start_codon:yes stop_codon:yes gene_type:complete
VNKSSEDIIKIKDLANEYRLGETIVNALIDVNLCVEQKSVVSIIGPSGSGKTTLLNMIGGLDRPSKGQVIMDGFDLSSLPENKLYKIRRSRIGFIFQHFYLIPTLTALENILVPTIPIRDNDFKDKAKNLLSYVGLINRQNHKPSQLSGGEQQRVAICRALINEPEVLLCDEITGELDTETGKQILKLLKKINQEKGTTIILVTHDEKIAEESNRIITLSDGRIVNDKVKESSI